MKEEIKQAKGWYKIYGNVDFFHVSLRFPLLSIFKMQKDLKRRSNVSSSRKRMISVAKCCRCFFQKNSAQRVTVLAVLHVAYLEELAKCDVIQSIRTVKHNTLFSYSFGQILSSFSLSCSRWTLGCASQMQL